MCQRQVFSRFQAERLLRKGSGYVTLLQNVCLWHPTKEISSCYNQALEMPVEQKDGSLVATCSSWEYFMQLVRYVKILEIWKYLNIARVSVLVHFI